MRRRDPQKRTWSFRLDLSSGQPVSTLFVNELGTSLSTTHAMKGEKARGNHVGVQHFPYTQSLVRIGDILLSQYPEFFCRMEQN